MQHLHHVACYLPFLLRLPLSHYFSLTYHLVPPTPLIPRTSNLRVPLWLSPLPPLTVSVQVRRQLLCHTWPPPPPPPPSHLCPAAASAVVRPTVAGRNGRLKKWTGDGRSEVNPSLGGQDDGRGWEFIHYDIANRNAYLSARKGCERAMFKMSGFLDGSQNTGKQQITGRG